MASSTPAMAEPSIPKIKGYLKRTFTPKMAGSVTPRKAEMEEVTASPLVFSCLATNIIPSAAAPWAMFDNASIGHRKVPPSEPISWISTARKV
ncbi:hypothetical protein D3C74_461870 [compost metagenome]